MRSLFVKILLWFLATSVIAVVGSIVILRFEDPANMSPARRFRGRLAFRLIEARHAYETGGREALQAFMHRMGRFERRRGKLTDAEGTDLLTGEGHPGLLQKARENPRRMIEHHGAHYVAQPSQDGAYWFFQRMPPGFPVRRIGRFPPWVLPPQLLWITAAFVIFCFLLARHLTSPVRSLERAVRRFGGGDFATRVGSTRKDEFGRLARTFDQMAERIQSLLSSQRRLLLDISHELRSPLTRLGLAVELARSEGNDSPALDRIQTEADRLNHLIGEVLAFNRSDADPSAMRKAAVRLDELLDELVEILSVEAEAKPCLLEVTATTPVTVMGDEELLRRAVENVIRNAIQHTAEDSAVEIRIEKERNDGLLTIRDHGPGVPASSLPRLFEPFYRVEEDRSRKSGGSGLGLAIARRSVELHGGRIQARNAEPGLLVELRLPAAAPAPLKHVGQPKSEEAQRVPRD